MTDAITSGATDLIGIARPLALQPELPTALLTSPDTARSDFRLKKIGIKKLDSAADLWWTQHQIQRLSTTDPDPAYGARRAVFDTLARRAQHPAPPPRRLARATMADFLTLDVYRDPVRRTPARRRAIRSALTDRPEGLRARTINHANTGTFTIIPQHYGTCLLLAWESPDAARAAWHGPLGDALGRGGRFRLDGEVARARTEHGDDHWHGWRPADDGAAPIAKDEPMVVLVHGMVRPRHLTTFLRDNVHAASRAHHHPGHRGSIDVHAKPPFENTSISIWSTRRAAQDFAYQPGGRARHETRPGARHPSGRRLPPGSAAGEHRHPRHRQAALPELPDADR